MSSESRSHSRSFNDSKLYVAHVRYCSGFYYNAKIFYAFIHQLECIQKDEGEVWRRVAEDQAGVQVFWPGGDTTFRA